MKWALTIEWRTGREPKEHTVMQETERRAIAAWRVALGAAVFAFIAAVGVLIQLGFMIAGR